MRRRMFLATLALAPVMAKVPVEPDPKVLRQYGKSVNFARLYGGSGIRQGELYVMASALTLAQAQLLHLKTRTALLEVTRRGGLSAFGAFG